MIYYYRAVYVGLVYKAFVLPFDYAVFLKLLPKLSFIVVEQTPQTAGSAPAARKGEVGVYVDALRPSLYLSAASNPLIISELESLERFIREEFGVDNSKEARYYEFGADLVAKSEGNPQRGIESSLSGLPYLGEFSRIIGRDVSQFGIRLALRGANPRNMPWFSMVIEPLVSSVTDSYFIQANVREEGRDSVIGFARNVEATLNSLIQVIERPGR